MIGYAKYFDEAKYMSFSIQDEKLLRVCYKIQGRVSTLMKKRFDCEPVYNKKYLKTKIKPYDGKINKHFILIKCQKKVQIVFALQ